MRIRVGCFKNHHVSLSLAELFIDSPGEWEITAVKVAPKYRPLWIGNRLTCTNCSHNLNERFSGYIPRECCPRCDQLLGDPIESDDFKVWADAQGKDVGQ